MTIDEAIEHAKEVARTCDDDKCIAEHIQLAEWLRQARGADKAARWYTEKIRKLEAENAMLCTQFADVTESMGRVEERCAKLRELAGRMFSSIRRFEVCSDSYRVSSVYEQWMRELGVEVKDG